MQIQLICVGKLKEKYGEGAIEEYSERLGFRPHDLPSSADEGYSSRAGV
jgi:23S rRNA pseudoU1915 N3-methylase RlmH